MTVGIHRSTRAVVDCQKIKNNIQREIERLPKGCELFAVVKANGYGHGAVKVAEVAKKVGASGFCVAMLDEAIELREAGFDEPILILGIVDPEDLPLVQQYDLSIIIASNSWLASASQFSNELTTNSKIKLHVKIDTGMNRIGYKEQHEVEEILAVINSSPYYQLEGICTHFSKADSKEEDYFHLQQQKFSEALTWFPEKVRYIHTANSATSFWHHHWKSNMVRFGIGMYGLNPSGRELDAPYLLEPAMTIETKINFVKKIKKGEHVGYGAEYIAEKDEWIGTVPIGYADGLRRSFKGYTFLVEGQKAEIVGRVCMDQTMIRLPFEVPINTVATFVGENHGVVQSMQEAAEYVQTINYEIPCALTNRVPRVYVNE